MCWYTDISSGFDKCIVAMRDVVTSVMTLTSSLHMSSFCIKCKINLNVCECFSREQKQRNT